MLSQSKIAASQDFLVQFNSKKELLKKETNLKSQKQMISELQKLLNSASFLPAYDQQLYSGFIREELDRISALEGQGRKKFSFKKTPKTATQIDQAAIDLEASKQNPATVTISREVTADLPVEAIKNKLIVIDDTQTDLTLKNYESCVITFTQPLTSLFLSNLKNCVVGPVKVETSILIQHLTNVKLQISSRQLRCHDSSNVHIYCSTNSGPIIEDCNKFVFLPWSSGGCFDKVEDFNWQKQSASPNFKIDRSQDSSDFVIGDLDQELKRLAFIFE